MQIEFQKYIERYNLAQEGEKIILAVSGGMDSMVLMELFRRTGRYDLQVAHCNFGLRGAESDADEKMVAEFCENNGLPFKSQRFDTRAEQKRSGESVQMAARRLRYQWFHQLMQEQEAKLATAHHLNDNLETILFNLTRGTGWKGLRGIPVKTEGIIRPLLFASRDQILSYARQADVPWREDASNQSDVYQRNYLRHHVIPELKKVNSSLEQTFRTTHERLEYAATVIEQTLQQLKEKCHSDGQSWVLPTEVWQEVKHNPVLLEGLISEFGFSYQLCTEIITARIGATFYSSGHRLVVDRDRLLVDQPDQPVEDKELHLGINETTFGKFQIEMVDQVKIQFGLAIACLDAAHVSRPIRVRSWKKGDSFRPLGMRGEKKVSDFMIDAKIPVNLKSQIPVLVDRTDRIIWLAGWRIDDRFKVGTSTKEMLKITWEKDDQSL